MSDYAKPLAAWTIGELVAALVAAVPPEHRAGPAADELLPVRAAGVEVKALRALERRGLVKLAKIGRKVYLRRAELLAAFDALATEQRAERDAKAVVAPGDSYAAVVHLERGRRRAS